MASLNSLDTSRQRGDPPAPESLPGYNPQGCGSDALLMLVMLMTAITAIAAKVVAG